MILISPYDIEKCLFRTFSGIDSVAFAQIGWPRPPSNRFLWHPVERAIIYMYLLVWHHQPCHGQLPLMACGHLISCTPAQLPYIQLYFVYKFDRLLAMCRVHNVVCFEIRVDIHTSRNNHTKRQRTAAHFMVNSWWNAYSLQSTEPTWQFAAFSTFQNQSIRMRPIYFYCTSHLAICMRMADGNVCVKWLSCQISIDLHGDTSFE